MRSRRFSPRARRAPSGVRHQVQVKQWSFDTGFNVVAGSTPASPAIVDTIIIGFPQLFAGALEANFKDIKVLGMHYDLMVQPVSFYNDAFNRLEIRDAIYEDALVPAANVPTHAGVPFLFSNELTGAFDETIFPRRIFFRRHGWFTTPFHATVGGAVAIDVAPQPQGQYAQKRIRVNARLTPDDCIAQRLEFVNGGAQDVVVQISTMAVLTYLVRT